MKMHGTAGPVEAAKWEPGTAVPRQGRRRWIWIALVAVALAAAAGYYFFGRDTGAGAGAQGKPVAPPPRVTVVVPGRTVVAGEVRVTGSIAARRASPVGVQGEGGLVTAVLVQEGDYVRRGQVLARIDRAVQSQQAGSLAAGIRQAEADAALAQSELDRAVALVARGFISQADVERRTATRDGARARVDVARAQLREQNARIARLDVRAPDDGLILSRAVEAGQVVGMGAEPLFRLAQDGAMEMRAAVAEQDLAAMRPGLEAQVLLVGGVESFPGTVALIEPTIDPAARQGLVRIALGRDRRLRPGAFARATITTGSIERPQLPQSAIQADDRGNFVLVVGPGDVVQRRAVEVGAIGASGISVSSGLTGRERVVASAGAFLNPGEKVTPVLRSAG